MERVYYYTQGRRRSATRLRTARVVGIPAQREAVSVPGWRSVRLGSRRFQLLLRADLLSERQSRPSRLEDLVEPLLEAERAVARQPVAPAERSLAQRLSDHSIQALVGDNGAMLLPTGEVAVRFAPGTANAVVSQAVRERGGEIVRSLSFQDHTYLARTSRPGDGLKLANALVEAGIVEFASPNFIEEMPWRNVSTPPNTLYSQQWHLQNRGRDGAEPQADVRALQAWQITRGSPEVVICILDSGIDLRHESFSEPGKLTEGFDFEDQDISPDAISSSHGTSCAGIAAAPWGTGDVVGIAPECRLMPIRRAQLSEHVDMAEAFSWAAEHGASVVSCSFGYDNRPWVLPDVVRAGIDHAAEFGRDGRGCVILWAAGNGNESIATDEWASYNKVIAVGASTSEDTRAPYSDFGPAIDICAPSSGGLHAITTTSNGGYTSEFGGTSAAAPLAAGVAALLLSLSPSLRREQVHQILRESADRIDPESGEYDHQGHSKFYGFGRVNAYRALQQIPVLQEVASGTEFESRLPLVQRFAAEYLEPRQGGRAILRFLHEQRLSILKRLSDSPEFRANVVVATGAVADAYEDLQAKRPLRVSTRAWQAVTAVARSLLSSLSTTSEDGRSTTKEAHMAQRSSSPEAEMGASRSEAKGLDDVLTRLTDMLEQGQPQQGGPSGSEPGTGSGASSGTAHPKEGGEYAETIRSRERLATELAYLRAIPPLTPDLLPHLDKLFNKLPQQLADLKHHPYRQGYADSGLAAGVLKSQASSQRSLPPGAMPLAGSNLSLQLVREVLAGEVGPILQDLAERGEGTFLDDPELAAVAEQILTDSLGENADRALISGAVAGLGWAIAGAAAGTAVGAAAKKAADNLDLL